MSCAREAHRIRAGSTGHYRCCHQNCRREHNSVIAIAAEDGIRAPTADDAVVVIATEEGVIGRAAYDCVIASVSENRIAACISCDGVSSTISDNGIAGSISDRIDATTAGQLDAVDGPTAKNHNGGNTS